MSEIQQRIEGLKEKKVLEVLGEEEGQACVLGDKKTEINERRGMWQEEFCLLPTKPGVKRL